MKKNLIKFGILLSLLTPACIACSPNNGEDISSETQIVDATSIVFKATGYNEGQPFKVIRGTSVTVSATVYPKNATDRSVTWSSDNADIEIEDLGDNKAKIIAWDVGTANITVTAGNYSQVLVVNCVTEIMPESIQAPSGTIEIRENTRQEVEVKVLPLDTTNNDFDVKIEPVSTKVENNSNGLSYIKEEETFYLKEQEGDIDDIYKVSITSTRNTAIKASFNVKIIPYEVESVSFRKENVVISLNDPTFRMCPKFEPETTSYLHVTFTSLNPDVCDIDEESGKLFPKKPGVATVRAISEMSDDIYAETTVTVNNDPSKYLFRGFTKEMMDELPVSTKTYQDMEFDKVAFAEWKSNFSEDSWYGHALDGGWAKWIVGEDYWNDNAEADDDRFNTMVYNKVHVPSEATYVQFVFRSHLHPTDTSLVRILMVDEEYNVTDLTNRWIEFDQTYDKYINFDMTSYQDKNLTFVIEQDQGDYVFAENGCCYAKHLQFRRMGFNVDGNTMTEDPFYELKDIND